ncbi:MAG: lipopolysaccharide biosynthesis protein, partial [Dysgonamonadaceae bacterium]|nr:lipopolysaccharide biosynthesis protein [Dysgonamonadaceae bacterium]
MRPQERDRDRRIARNTLLLYSRMFVMMAAGLYISRLVLAVLGIDDFGICSVVDGIVVLFAFLNGAMVGSSQRFISFELG